MWRGLAVCAALALAGCGGGQQHAASTTTSTAAGGTTSTTVAEHLTATATVQPDQGVAGSTFTFTVAIRGPGTGDAEAVEFGDGGTSGANAGIVHCGDTARADHDATYEHTYAEPGTYTFTDDVAVLGPPPACTLEHVTARTTLVVAAPLSASTLNGAFLSPTRNIACLVDPTQPGKVRCATFVPARLVTMDATGRFQTCTGSTCELGNPAPETPVLAYGSATGGGPFQCLSTSRGVTCTVVGHTGFTISAAGVTAVS